MCAGTAASDPAALCYFRYELLHIPDGLRSIRETVAASGRHCSRLTFVVTGNDPWFSVYFLKEETMVPAFLQRRRELQALYVTQTLEALTQQFPVSDAPTLASWDMKFSKSSLRHEGFVIILGYSFSNFYSAAMNFIENIFLVYSLM